MNLQPGQRLRSSVCSTEVIVVRAPRADIDLRCGGAAMVPASQPADGSEGNPASPFDAGTLLSKRYATSEGLELLCTKAGEGSLSVGQTLLETQATKPLPASD